MRLPQFTMPGLAALFLVATVGAADVKVAGLKFLPAVGDKAGNFTLFEKLAREAAQDGAQIVVAPEGALDGYAGSTQIVPDMNAARLRELAEPADGPYLRRVAALARELKVLVVFGFAELRGSDVRNAAAFFDADGRLLGTYAKSHLNPKTEFLYTPGGDFPVFDTSLGKCGLLICFDRQPPEPARVLAVRGARLLLIPGYSRSIEMINEDLLLRVRAFENGVGIVWVSPFNTLVISPGGEIVAERKGFGDKVVPATLPLDAIPADKRQISKRRPDLYQPIADGAGGSDRR